MRWSILIASHHTRHEKLAGLLDLLAPQIVPEVEAVVYWNTGALPVAAYRAALLDDAQGEWVSFVDDDDRVPSCYVADILVALDDDPDQVGFEVEFNDIDGSVFKPGSYRAFHSLKHKRWYQKGQTFYRDISHLNPVRTVIARQGSYGKAGRSEDVAWADSIRGLVESEVYIPKILYHYDYRRPDPGTPGQPPVLPEGFRFHPDSEV